MKSLDICFCVAVATGHVMVAHRCEMKSEWNRSVTGSRGSTRDMFPFGFSCGPLNTRHLVLFTQVGNNELHVFTFISGLECTFTLFKKRNGALPSKGSILLYYTVNGSGAKTVQ